MNNYRNWQQLHLIAVKSHTRSYGSFPSILNLVNDEDIWKTELATRILNSLKKVTVF
jgi:hypothetical protein